MIIDYTYFRGVITIEGINSYLGEFNPTNNAVTSVLNEYIDIYEREYFVKMFGSMCDSVSNAIASPENQTETMKGLFPFIVDKGKKISPIANYVFFHFIRRNGISASLLGATKATAEQAVSPETLLVLAWNRMVLMNKSIDCYIHENMDSFPAYATNRSMLEFINYLGI